jgi:hypothetical protein
MVAVRSLCGGAGASTLAFLIAASAAREPVARSGEAPVLVCDAGSATGGLALCARVESDCSLDELADALIAGALDPRRLFKAAGRGLRIVATSPRPAFDGNPEGVMRILGDASAAHSLTVVDCGTLGGGTGRIAARQATHVLSVLPATEPGVRRAEGALQASVMQQQPSEVLIARASATGPRATMRRLSRLADRYRMPLVLMPEIGDLAERDAGRAIDACEVTLQAIAGVLRR